MVKQEKKREIIKLMSNKKVLGKFIFVKHNFVMLSNESIS